MYCSNYKKCTVLARLVPYLVFQLSESDTGNFETEFFTQPARVTLTDPDVVELFYHEEFSGFTTALPLNHCAF